MLADSELAVSLNSSLGVITHTTEKLLLSMGLGFDYRSDNLHHITITRIHLMEGQLEPLSSLCIAWCIANQGDTSEHSISKLRSDMEAFCFESFVYNNILCPMIMCCNVGQINQIVKASIS